MQRRQFNQTSVSALSALILATYQQAHALSLPDLNGVTNAEAGSGLKTALEKGAVAAIALLGKRDGFLGNPKVRIPLPGYLEDASKLFKNFGQGKRLDELVTSINRPAETAVPMGRDLLDSAVRSMNVNHAKKILTGGETSITSFFACRHHSHRKSRPGQPIQRVRRQGGGFWAGEKRRRNIQQYVTGKSLDGLYLIITEEEKKIRQNPICTGSGILGKVFGALK